jgi:SAM-dependent methyltransferase
MSTENLITKNLICVSCKAAAGMILRENVFICANCCQAFPVLNNIPVLLNENESIFSFSDFKNQKKLFFDLSKKGRFVSLISRLTPSIGGNNLGKRNYKFLEAELKKAVPGQRPKVLIIGASIIGEGMDDFIKSKDLDFVEGDVSFGPRTKIVFDSHSIPYQSESFDCIIVQAVLEHVIDPVKCVSEIYRVLKPKGIVYAETPFMQQVHGGPYDFTRYTRSGHRQLFHKFHEIRSGATAGSGTSLAWSFQYFLLSLFGHTSALRLTIKVFARLTVFWLKYFDYLTTKNSRDDDGASGFYFIGLKSQGSLLSKEIINYYR